MNILLGVTGGIAAYKSAALASLLKKNGMNVNVVMTKAAAAFVAPLTFETLTENPVAVDMFADKKTWEVEHIALAKKADVAILAPATANTIAKLAVGMADNMLTTVFLALKCPIIVVPAMNTAMYANMATQVNLQILIDRGFHVMQPGEGKLACGDTGAGRMREPEEIVAFLQEVMRPAKPFLGKKIVVTAGPTREAIDPVRYITNRSSGKMGYAVAEAAAEMGADVTLVSGPVELQEPRGVHVVSVESAQQMYEAMMNERASADAIIMSAAVADYTPETVAGGKLKKQDNMNVSLIQTKDILAELGVQKTYYLVGFAAETDHLEEYAQCKLEKKNLDMIVANDVSREDIGFYSDHNAVTLFKKNGDRIDIARETKHNIAVKLLEEISKEL